MILTRLAPLFVLLGSISVLGTALLFQHVGGLQPCPLCLYQRYPYWATIALGVLAFAARGRMRAALVLAAGAVFLVGTGIAVFHVGVEQGWWQGPSTCSGAAGAASVEDMLRQIEAAPVVRCTDVAWSLAGISMAGYNAIASLALGLGSIVLATHLWRGRI